MWQKISNQSQKEIIRCTSQEVFSSLGQESDWPLHAPKIKTFLLIHVCYGVLQWTDHTPKDFHMKFENQPCFKWTTDIHNKWEDNKNSAAHACQWCVKQ